LSLEHVDRFSFQSIIIYKRRIAPTGKKDLFFSELRGTEYQWVPGF